MPSPVLRDPEGEHAAEERQTEPPLMTTTSQRSVLALEEFEGQLEMLKSELASSKRTVRCSARSSARFCTTRACLRSRPQGATSSSALKSETYLRTGLGADRDEHEGERGGVRADRRESASC